MGVDEDKLGAEVGVGRVRGTKHLPIVTGMRWGVDENGLRLTNCGRRERETTKEGNRLKNNHIREMRVCTRAQTCKGCMLGR